MLCFSVLHAHTVWLRRQVSKCETVKLWIQRKCSVSVCVFYLLHKQTLCLSQCVWRYGGVERPDLSWQCTHLQKKNTVIIKSILSIITSIQNLTSDPTTTNKLGMYSEVTTMINQENYDHMTFKSTCIFFFFSDWLWQHPGWCLEVWLVSVGAACHPDLVLTCYYEKRTSIRVLHILTSDISILFVQMQGVILHLCCISYI